MRRGVSTVLSIAIAGCAGRATGAGPVTMDLVDWSGVRAALDSAVASRAAPGAVLAVSWHGERFVYATGRLGEDDPTRPDGETVYDLASLTKVVALTPLVMLEVAAGRLDLDAPASRYVPAFAAGASVRQLLAHTGGLPAWTPLHQLTAGRGAALALVDTMPLDSAPGTATVYSDLGIMVLTQAVEAVAGARLDTVAERRVFGPLGMGSTRFLPPETWQPRIAPTELDPWRGRVLRGEVHDENAARLDGVSGHAGLFGTAEDLLAFGEWMVAAWHGEAAGTAPPVPERIVREFTRRQDLVPGSSRALGWDTPFEGSSAGSGLTAASFGHTGFTGTSLWIDPRRRLVIALLSNRVHPTRANAAWGTMRARIADLVVSTLPEEPR